MTLAAFTGHRPNKLGGYSQATLAAFMAINIWRGLTTGFWNW